MSALTAVTTALIIELATINLADGKTEADLIEASKIFQNELLDHQPGFVRRELVRQSEGKYIDIVHWRSQEDMNNVMQVIESSTAVQGYFSVMEFDPENPNNGVEHYSSIAVYRSLGARRK
jgi:hypothetical protein